MPPSPPADVRSIHTWLLLAGPVRLPGRRGNLQHESQTEQGGGEREEGLTRWSVGSDHVLSWQHVGHTGRHPRHQLVPGARVNAHLAAAAHRAQPQTRAGAGRHGGGVVGGLAGAGGGGGALEA